MTVAQKFLLAWMTVILIGALFLMLRSAPPT